MLPARVENLEFVVREIRFAILDLELPDDVDGGVIGLNVRIGLNVLSVRFVCARTRYHE